jgi:arginyl-tRNA synthetase
MGVSAIGPGRGDSGGYEYSNFAFYQGNCSAGRAKLEHSPGGSPPREILLDALSWLPERVVTAARRGRPDEFARYLEDLASVTVDVLSSASHPGSAPRSNRAPGSDKLTLAIAARTALAAGLGLLEVAAPDRL